MRRLLAAIALWAIGGCDVAKLETLTDPFNGSTLNEALWTWDDQGYPEAVSYSIHDGGFYFDFADGYAYYDAFLNADGTYDFHESQIVMELVQPTSGDAELEFGVDAGGGRVWFMAVMWDGDSWDLFSSNGTIHSHHAYNWATEKFLRLRETGGTVYYDVSPDGSDWTNVWSSTTGSPDPTSITFYIQCLDNDWNGGAFSSGVASINPDFNVTAVPPAAALVLAGQTPLAQIEAPAIADAYNLNWTDELGGSDDVYLGLAPSGADYAQSPLAPSSAIWAWQWGALTDPVVYTEHAVVLKVLKNATGGQALQLKHQLRQDYVNEASPGILIREDTITNIPETETEEVLALTEAEAATIFDYGSLYSRVVADVMPGGGDDRRVQITAGRIKVPHVRGQKLRPGVATALVLTAQTPAPAGVRRSRPVADLYVGSWTNELGETEDIYTSINEVAENSGNYARSPVDPGTEVYVWRWDTVPDPASSAGHVARIRIRKDFADGPTLQLRHQLRQGYVNEGSPGTLIREDLFTDVSPTESEVVVTLTGGQADSITDYSALASRVVAEVAA